jgi:hypothetical protein
VLLCHFGTPQTLTRSEISAKSNYSRTSEPFSRKSNHSRTYAKTGGWGCLLQNVQAYNSFVFFRYVNHFIN